MAVHDVRFTIGLEGEKPLTATTRVPGTIEFEVVPGQMVVRIHLDEEGRPDELTYRPPVAGYALKV